MCFARAGLLYIRCRHGIIGKCWRTFRGKALQSSSLNLLPPHFGHCSASACSPWKRMHLLSQAWIVLYERPNFSVRDLVAKYVYSKVLFSGSTCLLRMPNSSLAQALLTPCTVQRFMSNTIVANLLERAPS